MGTKGPHLRIVRQTSESRSKEYLRTGAAYGHRELAKQTEHKKQLRKCLLLKEEETSYSAYDNPL